MPRYSRKKKTTQKVTMTKKQTVRAIKGLQSMVGKLKKDQEVKRYDDLGNASTTATSYSTGLEQALIVPPLGIGSYGERVGEQLRAKSIHIRGSITPGTSASFDVFARVMLIKCPQRFTPDINAAGSSDQAVLESGNASTCVYSPVAFDNREHFKVLYDKVFKVSPTQLSGGTKFFKINKRLGHNVRFEEGDTTTPESGQVYLCVTSDVPTGNEVPTITWSSYCYFTDS